MANMITKRFAGGLIVIDFDEMEIYGTSRDGNFSIDMTKEELKELAKDILDKLGD